MAVCTITCPHCQLHREMDATAVPPRQVRATCPRCKGGFEIDGVAIREQGLTAAPPTPPPALAPQIAPVAPAAAAPPPPEPPRQVPPATEPPPAQPRSAPVRPVPFSFSGTAREYFGIWIVNTLLKIVTLGGYTAWAKVRTRRYLYGCTQLQGSAFDYLADPWALFRGWLIGALLAALYLLGSRYSPSLAFIVMLVVSLAMPWLIVRSRMFNCRNTSYRNIRFTFAPNYREAYEIFLGLGMLMPFTLGLIFPYMIYRQKKFLVENCSLGTTRFTFSATPKDYYLLFLKAGLGLLLVAGMMAIAISSLADKYGMASILMNKETRVALIPVMAFGVLAAYFYFLIYVQTAQFNLTWSATCLGRGQFRSELSARRMAWLYLSNAVAIACTFGLLIPWAKVRLIRYRLEQLTYHTGEGLGVFRAGTHQQVSAVGEEVGDIFGVDIAL